MSINFDEKLKEAIKLYNLSGVHPAAELPPMMSEEEYNELVEDVKRVGFIHSVRVTSDELLIDGRNRLCASIDAEKDVHIETFDPVDPISYVLSENKRRNLTISQRAMIGVAAKEMYAQTAKKKQQDAGGDKKSEEYKEKSLVANLPQAIKEKVQLQTNSQQAIEEKSLGLNLPQAAKQKESREPAARDLAAKSVNVSPRMIDAAEQIAKADPVVAADVKAGKKTINAAQKEIKQKAVIKSKSTFNITNDNIE